MMVVFGVSLVDVGFSHREILMAYLPRQDVDSRFRVISLFQIMILA